MSPQADKKNFLDASTNGKATLATSRRSFIAGWKLCAAVGLGLTGLFLTGRSASAQIRPSTRPCFLLGTRQDHPGRSEY